MSGVMSGAEDEDRAGLFVLGALNAEEMRAVRAEADRDPALAHEIVEWERRLTPLAGLVPLVAPPETLWAQLETRLDRLATPGSALGEIYRPPLRQRTKRRGERRQVLVWRGVAAASMAVAAGLLVALLTREPAPLPSVAMVMPRTPGVGGWLVTVAANGDIHAVAQGALTHTHDQDFELWALPAGSSRPVPLGLLPTTESAVLTRAAVPSQPFVLLVSLEPKGGSPTGLPTSPVMFGSAVVTR
jgi:anti-sigma-K factor RskA